MPRPDMISRKPPRTTVLTCPASSFSVSMSVKAAASMRPGKPKHFSTASLTAQCRCELFRRMPPRPAETDFRVRVDPHQELFAVPASIMRRTRRHSTISVPMPASDLHAACAPFEKLAELRIPAAEGYNHLIIMNDPAERDNSIKERSWGHRNTTSSLV